MNSGWPSLLKPSLFRYRIRTLFHENQMKDLLPFIRENVNGNLWGMNSYLHRA